jgi:hypothetical protein
MQKNIVVKRNFTRRENILHMLLIQIVTLTFPQTFVVCGTSHITFMFDI